ncbi:MAG: hypothetical protein NC210_04075 [[Clostridium] fimetarium]|nr:hypothetical protein [Alistipes timonensis]MCM1405582.1 hypothetical protein [[Clostridium] fimetarium]
MNKLIIDKIQPNTNGVDIDIVIAGKKETVKIDFSQNAIRHLTTDRADAIIMGLLMFAIRQNMDIESHIPISETLYYKLTHHFIPGICGDRVHQPRIYAEIVKDLPPSADGGIVATGISCGVDSLYSIMEHTKKVSDNNRLNHLVFLDAGAHHFGSKDLWDELYMGRLENARNFSKEVGLPLIEISTNLPEIFDKYTTYDHLEHHTYMMLSCLLMIQSGVSHYYYSGGYSYEEFSCGLQKGKVLGCAHYDLFILWCASSPNISFYSTGGSLNRVSKVRALNGYKPAEKYLNVCVASVRNCGHCFKCKRTLLELDASGMVDQFGGVFDINSYKKNRMRLIEEGYRGAIKGDEMLLEIMPFFNQNISPSKRFFQRARVMCGKIASLIRK